MDDCRIEKLAEQEEKLQIRLNIVLGLATMKEQEQKLPNRFEMVFGRAITSNLPRLPRLHLPLFVLFVLNLVSPRFSILCRLLRLPLPLPCFNIASSFILGSLGLICCSPVVLLDLPAKSFWASFLKHPIFPHKARVHSIVHLTKTGVEIYSGLYIISNVFRGRCLLLSPFVLTPSIDEK